MTGGVVIIGSVCGIACSALLMGAGHGLGTVLAGYPLGGLGGVALLIGLVLLQGGRDRDRAH